jgi:hypothetical protein
MGVNSSSYLEDTWLDIGGSPLKTHRSPLGLRVRYERLSKPLHVVACEAERNALRAEMTISARISVLGKAKHLDIARP